MCVRPVLYDVVNTDVCSHFSISRRGGGDPIQRRQAPSFSASRNTHLIQSRQAAFSASMSCSHSSISRRGGGDPIQCRQVPFSASMSYSHLLISACIQHWQSIDETSPSDSVRLAFCEFDGDASTAVYTGNQRLLYIYILIRMGGGVEIWKYSIGVVPFSRIVLVPSDPIEASNKDKVIHKYRLTLGGQYGVYL